MIRATGGLGKTGGMPTLPWARGTAAAAPTEAVVVLGSRLELRSYWPILGFLRAAAAVRKQARASPGALGVSLVAQLRGKTFWTLSAWVDQAALDAFVSKSPHRDVMSHYGPDLAASKFATFTIRPDEVPKPNSNASDLWRTARDHLRPSD